MDNVLAKSLKEYEDIVADLNRLGEKERLDFIRFMVKTDLFFLLWFVCQRQDKWHPWLLDRTRGFLAASN
jgi:hypothetical protein